MLDYRGTLEVSERRLADRWEWDRKRVKRLFDFAVQQGISRHSRPYLLCGPTPPERPFSMESSCVPDTVITVYEKPT